MSSVVPPRENRCEKCDAFEPTNTNGTLVGECRFNPPTVFMVAIPRPAQGGVVRPNQQGMEVQMNFPASFPSIPGDGWCKKFEPHAKAEPEFKPPFFDSHDPFPLSDVGSDETA